MYLIGDICLVCYHGFIEKGGIYLRRFTVQLPDYFDVKSTRLPSGVQRRSIHFQQIEQASQDGNHYALKGGPPKMFSQNG